MLGSTFGCCGCGFIRMIFEGDIAGKVKTVDHDLARALQRADGRYTKASRAHAVGAARATGRAETLLRELIHRAFVIPAGGKYLLLTFEDHCQIRR
jgi:hypothetical protein